MFMHESLENLASIKNEVNEIIELGLDGYLAVNSAEKLATTWATVKSKR